MHHFYSVNLITFKFDEQKKNDHQNVMNSNWNGTDQIIFKLETLLKKVMISVSHKCMLSNNFDNIEHMLKCTNKVFDWNKVK